MNVYTVPYAGGNAGIYYEVKKTLSEKAINIVNLDLPGHGSRFCEPLLENISDIVDDTFDQIIKHDLDEEYSLLGYSMGSIIVYEVFFKLKDNNYPLPKIIFLCACMTPEIMGQQESHEITDSDIIDMLVSYDGTPKEVMENQDMLEYILPIAKADFTAINKYVYEKRFVIESKGVVVYSNNELPNIHEWNNYFKLKCEYYHVDDGHFFIHDKSAELAKIIENSLIS